MEMNKNDSKSDLLSQSKVIATLYVNGDLSFPETWNALAAIKNKLERIDFEESEKDYSDSLRDCIL